MSMFAIKSPSGRLINNILEITERWAWAMLYSKLQYRNKSVSPSQTPPEVVKRYKEEGYAVVELIEQPQPSDSEKR